MRTTILLAVPCSMFLFACSSSHGSPAGPGDAGDNGDDAALADAAPPVDGAALVGFDGSTTAHGTIIDYFTLNPVPNLTVTAGTVSATTDSTGTYSLTVPGGDLLTVGVTGTGFTQLFFPEVMPGSADLDYGPNVMPTVNTFATEQAGLGNSHAQGLVQIVVRTDPTCASAVGGTLTVLSPPGTSTMYFASNGLPNNTVTSFQDVQSPRPVAVVYNVAPGQGLAVQITHPTCTQVPFPFTRDGRTYTGNVVVHATEPGDFNSALVVQLQ